MTNDKETIFSALYTQLTSSVSDVRTFGRRVKHYDDVPPQEQPALFVEQISAQAVGDAGHPAKQTLRANVLLYVYEDSAAGPMPAVNALVNQVEQALRRRPNEASGPWTTTLGGLVASARATSVEYAGGATSAQGVAVIAVEILTTS
jgi:hypothetical protein